MARTLSAKKRARQSLKKHLRNHAVGSRIKSQLKKTRALFKGAKEAANKESMPKEILNSISLIDKAVSKGIVHKNKAARLKSRLMSAASKALK